MKTFKFTIFAVALLMLLTAFGSLTTKAQGKFQFTKEMHDFGDIKEGVLAEHSFEFVNTGDAPIVISHVQASCGCTTPEWTREPIAPGQKGFIKAAYNSQGRPGAFYKTVSISSNAADSPTLSIKGNVLGNTPVYNEVSSFSGIKLDKDLHNFGKIQVGEKVSRSFTYTNTGTADLSIMAIFSNCGCVTYKTSAATVKPGESAQIELVYTPNKIDNREEIVTLQTNSVMQPQITVRLVGEVVGSLANPSILKEKRAGF